jgi:cyanophycin synthetase
MIQPGKRAGVLGRYCHKTGVWPRRYGILLWTAFRAGEMVCFMKLPYHLSVRLHRLQRALTRPVRNRLFRTVWKRNLPVAMITGTHGKTTTTRMLGNILAAAGHTVGLSTTDGIYIDGKLFRAGDYAGYYGARWVFRHREVTAAVLETAYGGLTNAGMFINQCDAGALVNLHPDHFRPGRIENMQQLLAIKRTVPDAARSYHVVNVADELCCSLLPDYDPLKVIGFSVRPGLDQGQQVLRQGGQLVTLDDKCGQVVHIAPDGRRTGLIRVQDIAATCEGLVSYNVENALAAAALGIAMNAGTDAIAAGLAEADAPFPTLVRRFRLVTDFPFTVVYDRVNGPGGFDASLSVFDKISRTGRAYGLLTVPGRQPADIVRQFAELAANRFDHVVCFEIEELRARRSFGEIAAGYANALRAAGLPPECVETADTEIGSFDLIASRLNPGDIVYIQR